MAGRCRRCRRRRRNCRCRCHFVSAGVGKGRGGGRAGGSTGLGGAGCSGGCACLGGGGCSRRRALWRRGRRSSFQQRRGGRRGKRRRRRRRTRRRPERQCRRRAQRPCCRRPTLWPEARPASGGWRCLATPPRRRSAWGSARSGCAVVTRGCAWRSAVGVRGCARGSAGSAVGARSCARGSAAPALRRRGLAVGVGCTAVGVWHVTLCAVCYGGPTRVGGGGVACGGRVAASSLHGDVWPCSVVYFFEQCRGAGL